MLPAPTSTILVAVLPAPRDLEIARLLGWYRIPLRKAPKLIAVDHLAFYQPQSFGEAAGRIEFTAPLIGHELTTRGELLKDAPDHPRSREEYFKLQLGGLIRLPQPVPAGRWRRFAFFYTTGEYLLRAQTVDDLVITGEDRQLVWRALRERALSERALSERALDQAQADVRYRPFLWPEDPPAGLLDELLALIGNPMTIGEEPFAGLGNSDGK